MRVLCVCTANVCRSPFLQLLLQQRLSAVDADVRVVSAGTRALEGAGMDDRTRAALAQRGIADASPDGTPFRASALTAGRVESADLTLTATTEHREAAMRLAPRALKRTFTLLEFAEAVAADERDAGDPGRGRPQDRVDLPDDLVRRAVRRRGRASGSLDLLDPVRVSDAEYRAVMEEIERAVDTIADRWPRPAGPVGAL